MTAFGLIHVCFISSGCVPPVAPPPPQPRIVRVDVSRYMDLHPASRELRELDAQIIRLERDSKARDSWPRVALSAPVTVELPTSPVPETAHEPRLEADLERAERAIHQDFALRREALPPLRPAETDTRPHVAQPPETDTRPKTTEPTERATGLDEQISRLTRQLAELKEKPDDRLIYTPAQLRRRRDLYQVTRSELDELHREQIRRLRSALEPPRPVRRAPRVPLPKAPMVVKPKPEIETRPDLREAEARELERVRANARLPQPTIGAPGVEARGPEPDPVRDAIAAAVRVEHGKATGKGRTSDPAAYAALLRERRAAISRWILEDLRAAAVAAGRRRGMVVTFQAGYPDMTNELRSIVEKQMKPGAGTVRR